MPEFFERRSGRDRRDWQVFTYPDRRSGAERRSGKDRRKTTVLREGTERRKLAGEDTGASDAIPGIPAAVPQRPHYSTAEVAELTGLSQPTLLLWIRNKVIDGSRIRRSGEGKRLWTPEDIDEVRRIKSRNGWT